MAARSQVDTWYFVADDTRIGEGLWLTSPQGAVLNRERLQEALGGHGQVFPHAESYRRAVDERLFRLGTTRYAALMDTLIQLRQPQLSKRPDEASLSEALTEAQPPLPAELLGDVADALNQLEEYRQKLESFEALVKAVEQFNLRYRVYAGINARREAGRLRAAQTEFDKASQAVNDARATLALAEKEEGEQQRKQEKLAGDLRQARAIHEALRGDPAMDEAKRLDDAKHQAEQARKDADEEMRILTTAAARLEREVIALQEYERHAGETRLALAESHVAASVCAETCGVGADFAREEVIGDAEALSVLDNRAWQVVQQRLRESLARRRDQLAVVRRRLHEADDARDKRRQEQERRDMRADEFEDAATRRLDADVAIERQGELLVEAWQAHFDRLEQLRPAQPEAALEALAEWVAGMAGDNPARAVLHAAQHAASERFAGRAAAIGLRKKELTEEREILSLERQRLEQGEDAVPPIPYFRAASARLDRPGAPLWQLLEFRETVAAEAQRAGLEAALEASGLLDAWVTPDGRLLTADGISPWHDTVLVARSRRAASAADWLRPAEQTAVAAPVVLAMLESIACGEIEAADAEAWVSPDGRFRVGPLAGAWSKPAAVYIGFAARAAARMRRLSEITRRLDEIDTALGIVGKEKEKLEQHRSQAAHEWNTAPNDEDLRAAHLAAAAYARAYEAAEAALRLADARLADAERNWTEARARLAEDAEDLHLPIERAALDAVDGALHGFNDALQRLLLAAQAVRHALPGLAVQRRREAEAQAEETRCREQAADKQGRAEEAQARWQALFDSIGSTVANILLRLENARQAVQKGEVDEKEATESLRKATDARARAEQKAEDCTETLEERRVSRQTAISGLQGFAASGLLAVAVPHVECPDLSVPWTIEPALKLARHAEQALAGVKADDEAWSRIQDRISDDFSELLRSLGALGHQAHAATSDHGLVVSVVYRNRPERPDRLETILAEEIAQRRELLTANERKLLENHLQAEVASVIQRMLREADRHVDDINAELDKRPTSTGVRFRLVWEALPEGSDGAPVGLEAARRKLLNTSADAWSAEDRRVVGDMLQSRIAAERTRADIGGGSLLEQLARALDYRRWHRFRVERWQGGKWGRLSGPASSGERALGLTVPLFAAVASHYRHSGYAGAPRLVLLDEAFAGIDREARAHCMALIREFDLDFVMTSESEWGCYAELPGVSICHLLRREGIDAVHVSRWAWDGRTRRAEPDPGRRFPAEA